MEIHDRRKLTVKGAVMDILVVGGTRYFGIPMVRELLKQGHNVTIATRQRMKDGYGDAVKRIKLERTDPKSIEAALRGMHYDVVYDKIAYCSNDVKYLMDVIDCDKYIYMSSTSVYEPKKPNTREEDFNGFGKKVIWCGRSEFPYEEIKRQAERALWQEYSDRNWIAVRYPFAIGEDDYTRRLLFYVEHTMRSVPMNIDNLYCQMGFIHSDEAGKFLAFLTDQEIEGAINGSASGTISLKEIIEYTEKKTGTKAVISKDGEYAPYNGEPEYSINTEKAQALGFQFSQIKDWIYHLLDHYIDQVSLLGRSLK